MFEYRGRQLNIPEQYIEDFEKYYGWEFDEKDADGYIYNKYIWNRTKESEVPFIVAKLSTQEIEDVINNALRYTMSLYTCNSNYGRN